MGGKNWFGVCAFCSWILRVICVFARFAATSRISSLNCDFILLRIFPLAREADEVEEDF